MPIINENDTVAVEELQTTFGDNDRLAAIVTNLIRAPLLVLLSDVDGLFDGDPRKPGSRLISTVERLDASIFGLVRDRLGRAEQRRHGQQAGSGPAGHHRRRERDHRLRPRRPTSCRGSSPASRSARCSWPRVKPSPPANAGSA